MRFERPAVERLAIDDDLDLQLIRDALEPPRPRRRELVRCFQPFDGAIDALSVQDYTRLLSDGVTVQ